MKASLENSQRESINSKVKGEWPILIIVTTKAHLNKIKCRDKEDIFGDPQGTITKANTKTIIVMVKAPISSALKTTYKDSGKKAA
jgi:hypothetical protein